MTNKTAWTIKILRHGWWKSETTTGDRTPNEKTSKNYHHFQMGNWLKRRIECQSKKKKKGETNKPENSQRKKSSTTFLFLSFFCIKLVLSTPRFPLFYSGWNRTFFFFFPLTNGRFLVAHYWLVMDLPNQTEKNRTADCYSRKRNWFDWLVRKLVNQIS